MKWMCLTCGYSWMLGTDNVATVCPNCTSDEIVSQIDDQLPEQENPIEF